MSGIIASPLSTYSYNSVTDSIGICEVRYPLWMMGAVGMSDNCVSIYCFWLFYNRMKILMGTVDELVSMQKQQGAKEEVNELLKSQLETMYIVRKCTILFGFTILTTWTSLGFIVMTPMLYLWTAIDSVINVWSLILHDKRYDACYVCLCKCIARTDEMRKMMESQYMRTVRANTNTNIENTGSGVELVSSKDKDTGNDSYDHLSSNTNKTKPYTPTTTSTKNTPPVTHADIIQVKI